MKIIASILALLALAKADDFDEHPHLRRDPVDSHSLLSGKFKKIVDSSPEKKLALKLGSLKLMTKSLKATPKAISDPEDDPDWPGKYPSTSEICVNIKTDTYGGEIWWRSRKVFDENTATASKQAVVGSTKQVKAAGDVSSYYVSDWNTLNALYAVEVWDTAGDGIFNGWITVTDKNNEVLWSAPGDYTYVAAVYLWMDSSGDLTVVASTTGGSTTSSQPSPPSSSTTTTTGSCSICDVDDMGRPYRVVELETSSTTCSGLETLVYSQLTPAECSGLSSATTNLREHCECPGYTSSGSTTTTTTTSSGGCPLCSSGSPGNSYGRYYYLDGDSDSCGTLVTTFASLPEDVCNGLEDNGMGNYLEWLCECPGVRTPSCTLCTDGDPAGSPAYEVDLGGETGIVNCQFLDIYFMSLSSYECSDFAAMRDFPGCGC